jgi:hypothetical protein
MIKNNIDKLPESLSINKYYVVWHWKCILSKKKQSLADKTNYCRQNEKKITKGVNIMGSEKNHYQWYEYTSLKDAKELYKKDGVLQKSASRILIDNRAEVKERYAHRDWENKLVEYFRNNIANYS